MNANISGKKVLITGGTTGLGRATASLLARKGCHVFVCGRNPEHLDDAIGCVEEQGSKIGGIAMDVGDPAGIGELFAAADAWLGGLDFAILNAGIGANGPLTDMTHEECARLVAVNLTSYIACSLEAMKRMSAAGSGHIVMTGSMSAHVFDNGAAVYTATKCGIRGFATSLRKEANPRGVKVSYIEPGTMSSDMVDESSEEQDRMKREMVMLRAEDVAETIVFILTRPPECDIISLQIRPHLQII